MKTKTGFTLFSFFLAGALLASCGCAPGESSSSAASTPSSSSSGGGSALTWTVTFQVNGGSEVAPQEVANYAKATKPADPTKAGYEFTGWYEDSICVTLFDFSWDITADWTLYAGWKSSEQSESLNSQVSEDSHSSVIIDVHGPEGSTPVDWWFCGTGSLWGDDGWSTAGGVQLFSNPGSETDKGCVLGITFAEGDTFKVTNGTEWFGYDKVDQSDGGGVANLGATNFSGDPDGYGGQNIKCTVSGTYDIYVNAQGQFWIQAAA